MKTPHRPLKTLTLAGIASFIALTQTWSATLIHRYQFNNNLNDSVGSVNGTATPNNTYLEAPTYITAAPTGATGPTTSINLGANAGTKNSGFSVANTALNPSSGSLSFWLNPGTPVSGDTTSDYVIYQPNIGAGLFVTINPNVNSNLNARVGSAAAISANGAVDPGTWLHAVVTWDITTGITLYVDGASVATQSLSGYTSTAGVRFGNFDLGNAATYLPNQYKGLIYDVQSYSGALSSTEVSYLYNNPGAAVPEPSAVLMTGLGATCMLFAARRRRLA